jgi:hypothetical protein
VKWLAILLALASLGGDSVRPDDSRRKPRCEASAGKQCPQAKKKPKPKKPKPKPKAPVRNESPRGEAPPGESPRSDAPRDDTPPATPTPGPGGVPTPTPTPTATPVSYPSRTGVDLTEWTIRSSYGTLAAGRVVFNASNLGEDDHNLAVRGSGREYGVLDVGPGGTGRLEVQLAAGTYTLYCSLLGHEEAGMRLDITVK